MKTSLSIATVADVALANGGAIDTPPTWIALFAESIVTKRVTRRTGTDVVSRSVRTCCISTGTAWVHNTRTFVDVNTRIIIICCVVTTSARAWLRRTAEVTSAVLRIVACTAGAVRKEGEASNTSADETAKRVVT